MSHQSVTCPRTLTKRSSIENINGFQNLTSVETTMIIRDWSNGIASRRKNKDASLA